VFKKNFLYGIILLLILAGCIKNDGFLIHGSMRGVNSGTVYLLKMNSYGEILKIDSTDMHGGEFRLRGKVDFPTMYYIQIGKGRPIDIFVENNKIQIRGSVMIPDEIKITGSKSHEELYYLQKEAELIKNKRNALLVELVNARKQKDRKRIKELENSYFQYPDSILVVTKKFVDENPASVGAAYFLCTIIQDFDINKTHDIITAFDPSIQESEYVRYLNEEIILNERLMVGSQAPDFSIPTSTNDTISLSDYEGKYLLLEFWASWCKASKERNKHITKIYNKYHDSGLEVLSISLDKEKEKWEEAIKRDSLSWVQASDLLYWESPVSKYYRVQRIPYRVLIDPQGKIVLLNPRENTLNNKLKILFGK
jgi:peroxiredoxin